MNDPPKIDQITTTLEREWFAQIVDRKKRIEYREIKAYWTQRLRQVRLPFRLVLRDAAANSSSDGAGRSRGPIDMG